MSNHERVTEIFLQACDLPEAEREAFVERACGGDTALKAEVEAMLAHDAGGALTGALAARVLAAAVDPPTATDPTPVSERIGPYRLLERIGEGGMGEVWLAEQSEPVRRRVALKIIKAGMDTKQVVARFEAERQALAMMDHPAIAKVFDAGATPEGRPYFVMEHIQGIPITDHCDRLRLTNRERLELFVHVCEGVQHAHHKAVIHRDLKPSNVLVTLQDGRAVPKIIDFGVAKATAQRLTEKTMFTELGAMVGTPEYMSPEQAEMTGQDIDTRTDVYALGVMLYELLVGALPFDSKELRSAGFAEIVRKIREDEPLKPSTRLSSLGAGSTESAKRRNVDVQALRNQLRGDLDWITMKALEKDRARRYGSPAELSADVVRHMRDEPVSAGAPSVAYRARKFARRHRIAVISAAGVALTLTLGIVGTTVGLIRARRAEAATRREAAISERVASFMSNALGDVDANRMGAVMIGDLKQRAKDQGLEAAVEETLSRLSGTDTARRLLRDEILGRAAKNVEGRMPEDPVIAAGLLHTIGLTYHTLGLDNAAEPYAVRALAIRERELGPGDNDTCRSLELMGAVRQAQGHLAEAEALHRRAFELRKQLLGAEHRETLRAMTQVAFVLRALRRYDEAERLYNESLVIHRRVLGPEHAQTLNLMNDLGFLYQMQERFQEAERLHRTVLETRIRTLGPEHRETLWSLYNVAWACLSLGRIEEAAALFTKCLDARRRVLGRDHPDTIWAISMQARVATQQGRFRDAWNLFQETIDAWSRVFGPTHPRILEFQTGAAYAAYMLGDLVEARRTLERGLATHLKGELGDDDEARYAFRVLHVVYRVGGWTEEARRLSREMLPVWRGIIARGGDDSYTAHLGIALALLDEGHAGRIDAEEALRQAVRSFEVIPKEHRWSTGIPVILAAQALAHHLLGHRSEAMQIQRRAIDGLPSAEKALRARFEADLASYAAGRRAPTPR